MAINPGDEWIFWFVIISYLVFLAAAGIYAKRKTKTLEDYMVASRSIGPILLGLSFGVTYFSAVMIVGGGQFSWLWGLAVVWIASIDVLVGVFLVFVLFGKRTTKLSEKFESMTVPQMLSKRYNEPRLQPFISIVILFFETIYLVSIYMGLSLLLTITFPADPEIAYTIAVIICAVITIIYLNIGGAHGAIVTDAAESVIMLVGVLLIFFIGIAAVGGPEGLVNTLTQIETDTATIPEGGLTTFLGTGGMGLIGYILVTSFGVWGMPQMIARFYTANQKKKTLRWGLVIACVWSFIVAIFAWFNGAISRAYFYVHDQAMYDSINSGYPWLVGERAIPELVGAVLPSVIAALFLAAVTAASLTTGEKVIMIAASGFSIDVYQAKTGCSDEKALKMTKITTTGIVVIAVFLALLKPGAVLALCMFAWSAMAAVILIPYVFGLFWKGGTAKAAIWTGVASLVAALLWKTLLRGYDVWLAFAGPDGLSTYLAIFNDLRLTVVFQSDWLTFKLGDIHEFIISQVVAIIAFPVISLVTKSSRPSEEFLKDIFSAMKGRKVAA